MFRRNAQSASQGHADKDRNLGERRQTMGPGQSRYQHPWIWNRSAISSDFGAGRKPTADIPGEYDSSWQMNRVSWAGTPLVAPGWSPLPSSHRGTPQPPAPGSVRWLPKGTNAEPA